MMPIDISPEAARELMEGGAPLAVIDVRRPDEFAFEHIPGAVNIVLDDILEGRIPAAMADKSALYLLYCRSGRRSGIAARWLSEHGWKRVHNFGGILSWPFETTKRAAGKPDQAPSAKESPA